MENRLWMLERADSVFEEDLCWDVRDIWQVVASKLDGCDILRLSLTSQWFWETLSDNTVWKVAVLNKLKITDAPATINHDVSFPWFRLYAVNFDGSHFYTAFPERHLNWIGQLGGFVLTHNAIFLMSELLDKVGASAGEKVEALLNTENFVEVTRMKPGIWIADLHEIMCICKDNCTGRMRTFDARHIELFATEEYRGGHFIFDLVGLDADKKEAAGFTTTAAMFDSSHMRDAATVRVFDIQSWEEEEFMVTPNGVAVRAYVGEFHNRGRTVYYYQSIKIRDEVLSIHVSFVT